MPKTLLGAGVLTVMVFTAPAALAQSETNSRYTMTPTENGFVRLDTVTGAMSVCSRGSHGWFCRVMGGKEDASEKQEIDSLKAENAELRSEILRLERRLSELRRRGSSDLSQQAVPQFELPKEEDVDEAVDYLEGMIRKFRERFENFGEKTRPGSGPQAGPGASAGSDSGASPEQKSSPDSAPDPTPDQKQDQPPAPPEPNSATPGDAPATPGHMPL